MPGKYLNFVGQLGVKPHENLLIQRNWHGAPAPNQAKLYTFIGTVSKGLPDVNFLARTHSPALLKSELYNADRLLRRSEIIILKYTCQQQLKEVNF
jgi:hypothetical protein